MWMVGVPTSSPTASMPGVVAGPQRLVVLGRRRRVGQIRRQAQLGQRLLDDPVRSSIFWLWIRVPIAVYSGASTSSPCACAAAIATRTGPQAVSRRRR